MSEQGWLQPPPQRASALRPESVACAAISIEPLAAATRFSLRLHAQAAAEIGEIGAIRLDLPMHTLSRAQGVCSARLGPDEWMEADVHGHR